MTEFRGYIAQTVASEQHLRQSVVHLRSLVLPQARPAHANLDQIARRYRAVRTQVAQAERLLHR
jgi:hypothetical protein